MKTEMRDASVRNLERLLIVDVVNVKMVHQGFNVADGITAARSVTYEALFLAPSILLHSIQSFLELKGSY